MVADMVVQGDGSVFLVAPQNDGAEAWIEEHVSEERTMLGGALAVEHRYIQDLCRGMIGDGLTVMKGGMLMSVADDDETLVLTKL